MNNLQFNFDYSLAGAEFIIDFTEKIMMHIDELDNQDYKDNLALEINATWHDTDVNITKVRINAILRIIKEDMITDALLKASSSSDINEHLINKAGILLNKIINDANYKVK